MLKRLALSLAAIASFGLSPLPSSAAETIRLATTTSTVASGLLDQILPEFQKASGIEVQVIAVGTGKALRMGADGDVDVVLVHARAAEDQFVAEGSGVDRRDVMYNEFVLVGPASDPAGVMQVKDADQALALIQQHQATFVSRGDDSGTHKKERSLWQAAGLQPAGNWYMEAGQGMGKVLQMASELDGYTLVDDGTWLKQGPKTRLVEALRGDPRLFNPYGIIAVNPRKHPHVDYAGATALIQWMAGPAGQQLIGQYKVEGKQLFTPSAAAVAGN